MKQKVFCCFDGDDMVGSAIMAIKINIEADKIWMDFECWRERLPHFEENFRNSVLICFDQVYLLQSFSDFRGLKEKNLIVKLRKY